MARYIIKQWHFLCFEIYIIYVISSSALPVVVWSNLFIFLHFWRRQTIFFSEGGSKFWFGVFNFFEGFKKYFFLLQNCALKKIFAIKIITLFSFFDQKSPQHPEVGVCNITNRQTDIATTRLNQPSAKSKKYFFVILNLC